MLCAMLFCGPLLASALQWPLMKNPRVVSTVRMAAPDDDRTARINKLEECIETFNVMVDDPKAFSKLMDDLVGLKKEGLTPGSSDWVAVVVEAEQRAEAFRRASQQQKIQRGEAFVRDRDWKERQAVQGLAPGSLEWFTAVDKASSESMQAYQLAEEQIAAARDEANRKRSALLAMLFADSSSSAGLATTDAALDVLFNSGYDVEGGSMLTQDDVRRMRGIVTSTSTALKRNNKDVALLLRRAAILVALGEAALARKDYERVLELEPANPEAKKYVDMASYGSAFDPYAILGVPRDAESVVITAAFRRLARQWHPDKWVGGSAAEQLEAETRFKQLNLAQGVLIDAAKRRKYDAGTASVADLMIGWWEKLTAGWRASGAKEVKARGAPALQGTAGTLVPANGAQYDVITVTLTGCGSGVGVGLDSANVVDMLVPGMPASKQLQLGDRVIAFDGQAMVEQRAGRTVQRKLKEVVKSAETHTVKVQRARKPGLPPASR